jgi:hypothetical protein
MNFDDWFKERTKKKIDKISVAHPMMSQVRRKADALLLKSYNNEIKSIFDTESVKPNKFDRIHFKLEKYYKYTSKLKPYMSSAYNKLSDVLKILSSKLLIVSEYINVRFNEKLIQEGKMDKPSIQATNSMYDYNRKLYRQLTFRRFGNTCRNLFGVQRYFIMQNAPVMNKPYYHIFYKIFKLIPIGRVRYPYILFVLMLGWNYRLGLISNKQTDVINAHKRNSVIYNEKKDKLFIDIIKFCNEMLILEFHPENYPQFKNKEEEIRELAANTLNHKTVFDLTCLGLFFIAYVINVARNFKFHKGAHKKLKFMTIRFIMYYIALSLIMKFTANNADGYFKLEVAKVILDNKDSDLNDFNFFVSNMHYLI